MKKSKLKIAVVIGLLCCMVFGMSVMAFNLNYPYSLGPNETKQIASFVPGASTIYINTRPNAGGNVTIYVGNASSTFPYNASRQPWVVTGLNPDARIRIKAGAGPSGASGVANVHS